MDLCERGEGSARLGVSAFVILVPWLGGAWYLLREARTLTRSSRVAIVSTGLLLWLVPLAVGFWLVGGPLGPKALS
jgi:hypothetical protein